MRIRVFAIAVLWAMSLVGVSVWAQDGRTFRLNPDTPIQRVPGQPMPTAPSIISGADIAFWPGGHSMDPDKVAGRWMVRINGEWRETTSPITTQRLN